MSASNLIAKDVRRLVDEYCSTQRHPSLPRFQVHGPYTLNNWASAEASNKPGYYAIYNVDDTLRYPGMSLTKAGGRLAAHTNAATQQHPFWQKEPAYSVEIIEVTEKWMGPFLEVFLCLKTRLGE